MESIVLFASFFILLIMMVPIGYAIGIATLIAILVCGDGNIPLLMISQKAITGCDSFPLMAVPFFMLAGNLMSGGGIAKRILNFFDTFTGFITGGLSMVTTITCMFFAAISGSAIATTSAVGSFMIPAMKDKGYHEGYSAAICAAAGTIGVIIPPSVPFVIYGVATGTSITDLFKAGVVPGIAMGVALMIACYILSKKYGFKGESKKFSFKAIWVSFVDAIWALLSPVIILGGIYSGWFTPTEAAVISVVYSYIIGRFVYKELDAKAAYKALREMTDELGLVLFVKVRLLDLAEPRPHHRKYQLYLNKVSAKHVDFVVCSAKSEPRLIIELDDFTHDTPSRQARDEFVDTVLESCGYGVVHTRNVDRDELYPVLRRLRRTRAAGK